MLYSLLSGRVVNIPVSLFLSLTDEEFEREYEELMCWGMGKEIGDPWEESVLNAPTGKKEKEDQEINPIEEIVPDLLDLSSIEKLNDLDLDQDLE